MITAFHHTNVTVGPGDEEAAKHFYGTVLGLKEVPKPEASRARGGAWYQIGPVQLHLSVVNGVNNSVSQSHFCLVVDELTQIRIRLEAAGVEILPDDRPQPNWNRFYVRDPGGNRIEIAQDLNR